ncbi:hypothetical protein GCM10010385_37980 [Streptomyces geysiriensis]|nr:hypothetical protein GCM10010385_37980 [Streptomyces geysiriensis]GGZ48004.1 hypothetical protein GCM10010301_20790 [Streptomyces plicatus]GHC43795.1 hypothetical protein GCM10010308_73780 [Streptomyces vinaceusdrappus]
MAKPSTTELSPKIRQNRDTGGYASFCDASTGTPPLSVIARPRWEPPPGPSGESDLVATEQATSVPRAKPPGRWGPTPISGRRHTHTWVTARRAVDAPAPGKWGLRPMGFPAGSGQG